LELDPRYRGVEEETSRKQSRNKIKQKEEEV